MLQEVLAEYNLLVSNRFESGGLERELIRKILEKAKGKSCSSRAIYSSNAKIEQKVEKIKLTGRSETALFAQILLLTRRKLFHRGLQLITPGTKEWFEIKEASKLAVDFCNEFGLPLKQGFTYYLDIGMVKMKNFSMHKFKSLHTSICKTFDATQELLQDKTPALTEECYKIYTALINDKIGFMYDDYKNNPEKYVCFMKAKQTALKFKTTMKVYIKSQFVGMEYHGGVPDPFQLYGDKAIERLRKYLYENNIDIRDSKKIDFKKIKK